MAYSPGIFMVEEMNERGWSRKDMVAKTGLSLRRITALAFAEVVLKEKDAAALSKAFGTGRSIWLNLQKSYESK